MKKLIAILLFSLVFTVNGCSNVPAKDDKMQGDKPPDAYIEIDNEHYKMGRGSYCWNGTCIDVAGPVELLADEMPIQVQPGDEITFKMDFTPKPNEIQLSEIRNEEETEIKVVNNHFTAPNEKGIYYYLYGVWWMDDNAENVSLADAFYAFALEVE